MTTGHWRTLFDAALERLQGNKAALAAELNVSRTMVSLVANNKYPGNLDSFARRVVDTFDRYPCRFSGDHVTPITCAEIALRPAPTSSPREMRHWRTCQSCPHAPKQTPSAAKPASGDQS